MINMKDLIKQQTDTVREETGMIKEASKKWSVKVKDIGYVLVDANGASEAKRLVARKLRGGVKDIVSVTRALPAKKVSDVGEGKLTEENENTWTIMYKGLLAGFKKSKDKRLEVVARAVSFLIKTQFGSGAKNDFIKAFKKSL